MISFILIEGLIIINGNIINIDDVDFDYMIVLGARLYGDVPSPALHERLKAAEETDAGRHGTAAGRNRF